ncbi:MAG: BLUF domain-containing protein [Burkholderiaceae bacterium]
MTELRSVSYISSTNGILSAVELERLLVSAREFNETVGVTGVLLYNGTAFFQYFEGDVSACDAVLERINCSSSHHSINVLVDQLTGAKHFSNWTMGFTSTRNSEILALSQRSIGSLNRGR